MYVNFFRFMFNIMLFYAIKLQTMFKFQLKGVKLIQIKIFFD